MLTEPKWHSSCHLVWFVSVVLCKPWGAQDKRDLMVKRNISLLALHGLHEWTHQDQPSACRSTGSQFTHPSSSFYKQTIAILQRWSGMYFSTACSDPTAHIHITQGTDNSAGRCCYKDNPDLSCLQPQIASGKTAWVPCRICLSCCMRQGFNALQRLSQVQYIQQTTALKEVWLYRSLSRGSFLPPAYSWRPKEASLV